MKNLKSLTVILVLAVLYTSWTPARAAFRHVTAPEGATSPVDSHNIEYVGHIGGEINRVTLQGDYAYVNEGQRLAILDISAPGSVALVGRSSYYSSGIGSIAVTGGYAYLANYDTGLRVLNISNPIDPVEVTIYDTPGSVNDVMVAGTYAYLADYASGEVGKLRVLDVSDPASPIEVGSLEMDMPERVVLSGSYAYVVQGNAYRMLVVDISDPSNPIEVGSYDPSDFSTDVAVAGDYAYLATWGSGMRVLDVSDPTNPAEVGIFNSTGNAGDITVQGNFAYLSEVNVPLGLRIVDVSDPSNPTEAGFHTTLGAAYGVAVKGDYAYVADSTCGLLVVNVTNPAEPVETDYYIVPTYAVELQLIGDYAYVANNQLGLQVVDVSNPKIPLVVDWSVKGATDVEAEGIYAYIGNPGSSGMLILDVSDPAHPTELSFFGTPTGIMDIAVAGGYAYLAEGQHLRVIDISDPTNPVEVGLLDTGNVWSVTVAGEYAYLGVNSDLSVVNVSDPTQPAIVGGIPMSNEVTDVDVFGDYAYVANWSSGLRIVDVTNPAIPTEVGYYITPEGAASVAIEGSNAFVAAAESGLRMINISDPTNPIEVGYYDTPDFARSVSLAENLIYVADRESGLIILRQTSTPITTTISILSDDPDPSLVSQPFTVTFGVTSSLGIPTGVVTVTVSEVGEICSGELMDGLGSCQVALSTPGTYTLNADYAGEANFLPSSASEVHSVEMRRVHLPLVIKSPEVIPGLTGKVTENGVPVAGIPLDLRFYNGSSYSTYASTTTDIDGNYLFSQVPALQSGQNYYVRYRNDADIDTRLAYWHTADNVTYNGATLDTYATFDIANIVLLTPDPEARVNLPITFTWVPRPAYLTDSYEFELFDPTDDNTYFYTDPLLGYVSSFTLQGLPNGFEEGVEYGWAINVLSPEGGFGGSYYYHPITFK